MKNNTYLKGLVPFAEKVFSCRNQLRFAWTRLVITLVFILIAGFALISSENVLLAAENNHGTAENNLRPTGSQGTKIELTSEERAWIKAHPIIRFGTDESWAPYVIKKPDGTVTGLNIDLLNYINDKTGTNIQLSIGTWSEIVQKAKAREIDGLANSTRQEEREELFNFSERYVSVFPVFVVAGTSSIEINGVHDFAGKSVAVLKSNRFHINLLRKHPTIDIVEVPSEMEALKLIIEGKVDAAVVVTTVYSHYVKTFGDVIKIGYVATNNPLHIVFSVRKDWPELVTIIDKALLALPIETKNDMFFRWLGHNPEDLRRDSQETPVLLPEKNLKSLTEVERSWIKDHPKITLGAGISFGPFIMTDSKGSPIGFDADIAKLLTERTGLKIGFEFGIWADIQERAKKRQLDGLSTALPTKERSAFYNASESYTEFASLIIVKRGNRADIHTIDDIAGKRLGLQRGNASETFLDLKGKEVEISYFDGIDDVLKALVSEKVDFMLNDESIFYLARKLGLETMVEAAFTIGEMNNCHFLIRKDWPLVQSIIDKGLSSITEDERLEIRRRWFQVRSDDPDNSDERIILTAEERAWIKLHPEIILGAGPARQPLEYVDPDGRHRGIVSEYVKILNRRLGLNMKIAPNLSWSKVMEGVHSKTIDVLPGVARTAEREKYLGFCEPYHFIDWVVISRADTPIVHNLEELKGRTTAVNAGYASHHRMREQHSGIPLLPLATTIEVLQSVIDGKAEAAVVEMSSAILIIQGYRLQSLKLDNQIFKERDPFSFAVRKDWPELTQILNKGLNSITKEERRVIRQKCLAVPMRIGFTTNEVLAIVFSVIGVMGVFLLVFLFSNRRLEKEVRERVKAEADLRTSEESLRQSEEFSRAVMDYLPIGLAVSSVDSDLSFSYMNDNFPKFYRTSKESIDGPDGFWGSVYEDPAFREEIKKRVVDDCVSGNAAEMYWENIPITRKNGSTTYICAKNTPIPETNYMISTVWDVTKRRKAEENLREKTALLEAQANATIDGILVVDTNQQRVNCNKRFIEFFNIPTEILADSDQMVLVKYIADLTWAPGKFFDKVSNIYDHPHEISTEEIELKNGLILDRYTAPIVGDDGNLYGRIWTFHDITQRKRSEEERGKLVASVQRTQKLESLGVLAGGIAHDFNNLLGGIFGYIDMAIDETVDDEVSTYLTESMNNIDRARALTQQLLTFAKGGAPIRKVDSLFPFVQKTAEFALSGSSVSSKFDIQDDLWQCDFDKNQLGQVVDNLTINAIQAMPNGGTIEFIAQNLSVGAKDHVSLLPGNYVKLSIKDQGIGIPEDFLPRIFDPYYSTKSRGSGLGLSTSYSIINRHDGCLDVESDLGKGSVFNVFLPASNNSKQSVTAKSARLHKGSGTFLVMDDEAPIRRILQKMLKSFGYTVVQKENGRDTIDFINEEIKANRGFAGMIFDLTIPGGIGGEDAIKEVRKMLPDTPVFVSSGYGGNSIMANPHEYGFTASLCKPFRKSELVEMLEENLTISP